MNSDTSTSKTTLPLRQEGGLTSERLCWMLKIDYPEEIYNLSYLLRAGSLNLYAVFVNRADENGRLLIKMRELMSAAGMSNIATFYKHEQWLMNLSLIEKKPQPGLHDGSYYWVYALESLPIRQELVEEFRRYLRAFIS